MSGHGHECCARPRALYRGLNPGIMMHGDRRAACVARVDASRPLPAMTALVGVQGSHLFRALRGITIKRITSSISSCACSILLSTALMVASPNGRSARGVGEPKLE